VSGLERPELHPCSLQTMWFRWLHQTVMSRYALGRFAAECEAVCMRVSTSKSEAMTLCWKTECALRVGSELLPQAKEFKYLGVLFTSEGKMEREMDKRIGAASAVMWALYRSIYVPTLTYAHKLVSDQKNEIADTSSQNEFPPQGDWTPLLLERSQLRWFGHLIKMPLGRLRFPGMSDWD